MCRSRLARLSRPASAPASRARTPPIVYRTVKLIMTPSVLFSSLRLIRLPQHDRPFAEPYDVARLLLLPIHMFPARAIARKALHKIHTQTIWIKHWLRFTRPSNSSLLGRNHLSHFEDAPTSEGAPTRSTFPPPLSATLLLQHLSGTKSQRPPKAQPLPRPPSPPSIARCFSAIACLHMPHIVYQMICSG